MVIFGASGDLTARKLVPALYRLAEKGRLGDGLRIVGFSRTEFSHDVWRETLKQSTTEFLHEPLNETAWNDFAKRIYYQRGDIGQAADFERLAVLLNEIETGGSNVRVFYLATAPRFFEPVIRNLGRSGLSRCGSRDARIVVEKPFGSDRESAGHLNATLHECFAEEQVYRIDHYLGKETVQNILVLRFANAIFEPIWNRTYIDHVQITAAEEVKVGRRGGYYDRSGVLRDMFQNHLLQLLTFTAMEAPSRFKADAVRNEKVKVLEAIRPMDAAEVAGATMRAQYEGYHEEPGVADASETATFAALRLSIDNWRWQGVPFYLRSGKALACRTTQILIQFREPPHRLFDTSDREFQANQLLIQIQPAEGIQLYFQTKVPDAGMHSRLTNLDFRFDEQFAKSLPDAYERLLLDVVTGDASLFARSDEVELAWGIIDPILAAWQSDQRPKLHTYPTGGWGPDASREWIEQQRRQWFDVCPVL